MTAGVWNVRDFRPICAGDVDHSGFEVMGPDGSIGVVDSVTNKASASYLVVNTGGWPRCSPGRRPAGSDSASTRRSGGAGI